MAIPSYLLKQKIVIEEFKGEGAYGPIFDKPKTAKCRLEPSSKLIRKADGTDVQASAKVFLNISIPKDSRVLYDKVTYVVLESTPIYGLGSKPSHTEVILG